MTGLRIAVVTDAWHPQVNGVVRTLSRVADALRAAGHRVLVVGPDAFRTVPCPTYPAIRLALLPGRRLGAMLERFRPDRLHVATEGPLGWAARRWARRAGMAFSTSLHTRFPDYLAARGLLPRAWGWAILRRFHGAAACTMVSTERLRDELGGLGFRRLAIWARGVDTALFRPAPAEDWGLTRPVLLAVGRVAVEKNLQAFLDLDCAGSKVVVGDGPLLPALRRRYPGVRFTGALEGAALARAYAGADALVFPSRTDTFGLVLLEAMACGLPVAAYPVPGPLDVVGPGGGVLDAELGVAVAGALRLERAGARRWAERFSWAASAEAFLGNLVPGGTAGAGPRPAAARAGRTRVRGARRA